MYFGDPQIEGLDTKHPQYSEQEQAWQIMSDTFGGELVLKKNGEAYLPRLYGMSDETYLVYLDRAYFYGATSRVIKGAAGVLLAQEPSLHSDDAMVSDAKLQEFYNNLAPDNSSFNELVRSLCTDFILKGRIGCLVDGERMSDQTFIPKIIRYRADDIVNWDYSRFAEGEPFKLNYVILREERFVPQEDAAWVRKREMQYRVLWLAADTGFYNQAVYRKIEKKGTRTEFNPYGSDKEIIFELIEGSHVVPTKGGRPMTEIPFWAINYGGASTHFESPPMLELALMNISHFKSVAALENSRFFAGVPTVVTKGLGEDQAPGQIQLGTGKSINLDEPDSSVEFLELSGSALSSLETAIREKEEKMMILGSRILSPEPNMMKGAEATATHKLRRRGEQSIISSISDTLSAKLTTIVQFAAEWGMKANPEGYRVSFAKDFMVMNPDSGMLVTLSKLVAQKMMSFEAWFEILHRMEMIPRGTSIDEELKKIESGKGSELIASLIEMETAPKVEEIEVTREAGNLNGQ